MNSEVHWMRGEAAQYLRAQAGIAGMEPQLGCLISLQGERKGRVSAENLLKLILASS